ncbi:hypothetical protein CHU92_01080, partial [Flavobacterium cyanobacteriorum]
RAKPGSRCLPAIFGEVLPFLKLSQNLLPQLLSHFWQNSVALYEEGYEMEHCVADYTYDCMDGHSAIFSLRKFTPGVKGFEILATLQVIPETKAIVQAKAKYNDFISAEAEEIVALWAKQEGLVLDYHEDYAPPAEADVAVHQVPEKELSFWWFVLVNVLMQILIRACDNAI